MFYIYRKTKEYLQDRLCFHETRIQNLSYCVSFDSKEKFAVRSLYHKESKKVYNFHLQQQKEYQKQKLY